MLVLYSSAIFISALLLFSLEPMVGKMLLPRCGGGPSVWNTCMTFFQAVLLLGYSYSFLLTRCFNVRRQAVVHLLVILLPLLVLPVFFGAADVPPGGKDPTVWLVARLTLGVGLPFFVLTTTAPLLQRWFSETGAPAARDPYFLYATSNAGSLIALLSYPLLVEPTVGLLMQSCLWTAGYFLQICLMGCCAIAAWRCRVAPAPGVPRSEDNAERPCGVSARLRLSWIALALVPSSLMLGATAHITTDIASLPLLWVVPLALYLLTFVLVFARRAVLPHWLMIKAMPYAVVLMPLLIYGMPLKFWMAVPAHLLTFFVIAMVCHGELARTRPESSRLTEFYFLMGVGGVLGGLFNTLAAPLIFRSVVEYPLMLVAACFLRPSDKPGVTRTAWGWKDCVWLLWFVVLAALCVVLTRRLDAGRAVLANLIVFGVPAVLCFLFRHRPIRFAIAVAFLFVTVGYYANARPGNTLLLTRDFFGVKRVCLLMDDRFHALVHGNTTHGLERMHPRSSDEPLAYYSRQGPAGDVFGEEKPIMRVAVIGLGAGSMAAYARQGDHFSFYEIDPAVARIAEDPQLFTFLAECRGTWDIVLGDGRIELAKAPDHEFDLIVLDAFSSDSIPMHLLTQEAMDLYLRKLKKDGVLVLHISNRYLNLEPALARLAAANELVCLARADLEVSGQERQAGIYPSHYLVMARRVGDLGALPSNSKWRPVGPSGGGGVWTDDYSNIIEALRW